MFERVVSLIKENKFNKLQKIKVLIIGLGGVGGYALETLVRSGVINIDIIDFDKIDITNLNRQIIATKDTIGLPKVEVAKERILKINPDAKVEKVEEFFMPDSKEIIDNTVDYIVDAIDTVTAKIELVIRANKLNIPIISCMGTGNKLDPTKFEVTDIYKTEICPLAKVMRKELKKREIKSLKVVYSKEEPKKVDASNRQENKKENKSIPGSISFVPSVAGLIIAGEVVKDLIN